MRFSFEGFRNRAASFVQGIQTGADFLTFLIALNNDRPLKRDVYNRLEDRVIPITLPKEEEEVKEFCGKIFIVAGLTFITSLALGALSLIALISGELLLGTIGFTACALVAALSYDIMAIVAKVAQETFQHRGIVSFVLNPLEILCIEAAKQDTLLIGPGTIRVLFSPIHREIILKG